MHCFAEILERIMYNRLYAYLTENEIFFNKQFGSRAGHSTEHGLSEVVDQIYDNFDKKIFWGIYVKLSRAFDTTDHRY